MDPLTLRQLANQAPMPVARLAERAQNDCSPERRHHNSYYVWELWIRLLSSVLVSTYRAQGVRITALDESIRKFAHPSAGHFVEFLRNHAKTFPDTDFARWWSAPVSEWVQVGYQWACDHSGTKRKGRPSASDFADAMVAYRNRNMGHGALHDTDFYNDGSAALFGSVGKAVLAGCEALPGRFLAVEEVTETDSGDRLATVFELTGSIKMRLTDPMTERQLPGFRKGLAYFEPKDAAAASLSPLLLWEEDFVVVLNNVASANIEYLNYFTGELKRVSKGLVDCAKTFFGSETGGLPQPAEPVRTGKWIGDYQVLGELGRGGMGAVYLARQVSMEMKVALKVLPSELAGDKTAVARFRREAEILKKCEHPSIISTLEYGEDHGTSYFAMELVSGCALSELYETLAHQAKELKCSLSATQMRRAIRMLHDARFGTVPAVEDEEAAREARRRETAESIGLLPSAVGDDAWKLLLLRFAEVADALAYLHAKGVIHRDIKPSNIMLSEDGERAVVMDLGIARTETGTVRTRTGSFMGTLRYASREQVVRTLDELDYRADLYSLGATMYEMLTLTPLFADDEETAKKMPDSALLRKILDERPVPACERNPSLRAEIGVVLDKLLEKQSERRFYNSAAELAEDLRSICAQRPIRAREYSAAERRAFELFDSLRAQANTWNSERKPPDLLWGIDRVDEMDSLQLHATFDFDSIQQEFFEACGANADRLRREREELEQRDRDRAQKVAESARQRRMLRRSLVGLVITFLVVLAGFGFLSWRRVLRDQMLAQQGWEAATREYETAVARRAEAYVIKGHQAAREAKWDEASLHFASALALQGARKQSEALVRAADGLTREANLEIQTTLVWRAKLPCARTTASISHDGEWVGAVCNTDVVHLRKAVGCQEHREARLRGDFTARTIAFSPRDSLAAIGTNQGPIVLMDTRTGEVGATLGAAIPGAIVDALAFSADGSTLAIGRRDGVFCTYSPVQEGGKGRCSAKGKAAVRAVALSANGKLGAAAGSEKVVWVWETPEAATPLRGQGHTDAVKTLAFAPGPGPGPLYLFSGGADNRILRWRLDEGRRFADNLEFEPFFAGESDVHSVALSPDGAVLASGNEDNTLKLWLRGSAVLVRTVTAFEEEVESITFSPRGELLVAATSNGVVSLLSVRNRVTGGQPTMRSPLLGHTDGIEMLDYSDDGNVLLSTGDDDTVRLWDTRTGRETLRLQARSAAAAALSNDGKWVVAADENAARRWSVAAPEKPDASLNDVGAMQVLAIDPPGQRVALGMRDGTVRIWSPPANNTRKLVAHEGDVYAVQFAPGGRLLVSSGVDRKIRVWDLTASDSQEPGTLGGVGEDHEGTVYEFAFLADGRVLASASADQTVRLWDMESRRLLSRLEGHRGRVFGVAAYPNGPLIATASKDGTTRLYDVSDPRKPVLRKELNAHLGAVYTPRFSPDGRFLATCSEDKTIRLFETTGWRQLGWEYGHVPLLGDVERRTGLHLVEERVEPSPPTCR